MLGSVLTEQEKTAGGNLENGVAMKRKADYMQKKFGIGFISSFDFANFFYIFKYFSLIMNIVMKRAGRAVHARWTIRADGIKQVTTEEATKMGLTPYAGPEGLTTVKSMRYNGNELVLAQSEVPEGVVAYVTGKRVRHDPFDFVPVQFYMRPI